MIVRFNPQTKDLQRFQVGPIGPHLQSFAEAVAQQGYCDVNGWLKIRLVAKMSRWLQRRRVPLDQLNEAQVAAFLNARWKRLARHAGAQITMTFLLRHLRQIKVLPPSPLTNGSDICQRLAHGFERGSRQWFVVRGEWRGVLIFNLRSIGNRIRQADYSSMPRCAQ